MNHSTHHDARQDHAQPEPAATQHGDLTNLRGIGHQAMMGDEHHGHDAHAGHDKHAGHSVDMFRDRFWLSLILTIPVVLYSEMVQGWLNFLMRS